MLDEVISYDDDEIGFGTVQNKIEYEYNDFGQLTAVTQEHDTTTSEDVIYSYEDGSNTTKVIRQKDVQYPNGRTIEYDYGTSNGMSDILGRVETIKGSDFGVSNTSLVKYTYLGANTVVTKDYERPDVRLDYIGSTAYEGFDRFGRIERQRWTDYGPATDVDLFDIKYGYDRTSNRKYADRQVYQAYSQVYAYDGLDRLTQYDAGVIKATPDGIQSKWQFAMQNWNLDPLGNDIEGTSPDGWFTAIDDDGITANELTEVDINADAGKLVDADEFNDTEGGSTRDWENVGTADSFDINPSASGKMKVTSIGGNEAILLFGDSSDPEWEIGPAGFETKIKIPTAFADKDMIGIVFGYKSINDYWLRVFEQDGTAGELNIYHVLNGNQNLQDTQSVTITAGSEVTMSVGHHSFSEASSYDITEGYPSGRVGVYTTEVNTEFDYFRVWNNAVTADLGGRWLSNGGDNIHVFNHTTDSSKDALQLVASDHQSTYSPALLRGVRVDQFEIVFSVKRPDSTDATMYFVFGARDLDNYSAIRLSHATSSISPAAHQFVNGQSKTSPGCGIYGSPTATSTDMLWYRIYNDGTDIKVYGKVATSQPTTWDEQYDLVLWASPGDFDLSSGMIGFAAGTSGTCLIDNLTIKADHDEDGTYDTTEYTDDFTIDDDTNGTISTSIEYDAAGNLIDDGIYVFRYDAWNRLVTIEKSGCSDAGTGANDGCIVGSFEYDGTDRRIIKSVNNFADLDQDFHYYYDGQRIVEIRDSSNQTLSQYVWESPGSSYVDELVQIAINQDPGNASTGISLENNCERFFYVLQDANFNVLGLVNSTGILVERYEYTPYGQRTVFNNHGWLLADLDDDGLVGLLDLDIFYPAYNGSPDADHLADFNGDGDVTLVDYDVLGQQWGDSLPMTNDPMVSYPAVMSFRDTDGLNAIRNTPLNPFGHQGLLHDEEFLTFGTMAGSSLIHNRARTLNPGLGRFIQRDPLGYVDGMNLYEYTGSNPVNYIDPYGQSFLSWVNGFGWSGEAADAFDNTFSQVAHDRTLGTGDAIVSNVSLGFVESVGGVAFDPCQRQSAKRTASTILTTTEIAIGGTALVKVGAKKLLKKAAKEGLEYSDDVARMVVKNSDDYVNLASKQRTKHILQGDGPTRGGHMWPGNPGKTIFPRNWSADKIMHEVSDIATDPAIKWVQQTGKAGAKLTKKGDPVKYVAEGIRDNVTIRVIIQSDSKGIITAFPIY